MKFDKKIILILILIGLVSIVSVSAADDSNITNGDLVSDEGVNSTDVDKTFTELQTEIEDNTNGTVDLVSDYKYEGQRNGTGIVINKSITINGNGHTLDGNNNSRIFNIIGGEVVLNNITFKNGYSNESMGAVRCFTKLTLANCTFIDNFAEGTNARYNEVHDALGVVGGAVYIYSDDCTIENNRFINNTVWGSGGGLAVDGKNHKIINNYFDSNQALRHMNGGALHVGQGANTIIRGNTFIDNFAGMGGGAIELQNSSGDVIENNIFIHNHAEYGGAISIYHTGQFTLKNNTFDNNYAKVYNDSYVPRNESLSIGGVIRVYIEDSSVTSYITENKVYNSRADTSGGAFYIYGNNVVVSKNTFKNTTASKEGAGAILGRGNDITISNNIIQDSTAGGTGGAIYILGNNAKIISNNINNAKANAGGAVYVQGDNTEVTSNTITNCVATVHSGAVYIKGKKETVSKNTFTSNAAENNGGALRIDQTDSSTITENIFNNNNAPEGTAIKLTGNNTQIANNRISNYNSNAIVASGSNIVIKGNKMLPESTSIAASASSYLVTKTKSYVITLKDSEGKALASKSVTITVGGKTYKATTNTKGQATYRLSLTKVGSFKAAIKFAGDTYYKASSKTVTIKTIKEKSKISAPAAKLKKSKAKKITVTLKSNSGAALAKKVVILKVAGKNFKAKTNAKGKAAIKVKVNKKGKFTYKVTFKGDSQYYGITKKGKITVR